VDFTHLIGVVLLVGMAIYGVVRWWNDPRRRARELLGYEENIPIGSVRDGQWVKVTGSPAGPVVRSPVGGVACIGFRLQVVRVANQSWSTILDQEFCPPFTITDDTGTAEVDGPFQFAIVWADDEYSRVKKDGLETLQQFGVDTRRNWLTGPEFRYREAWLQPGVRVTVFGRASVETDPIERPRELRSPAKIHLRGSGNQPVIVAYPNKADD